MYLTSTKNEKATSVAGRWPQTETPRVLELTTVADALLPGVPPPLAYIQKPKALVANVRCHHQPTFEQSAGKYARGVRKCRVPPGISAKESIHPYVVSA